MTHLFETEFELPRPLAEVFDFFAAAENLAKITPPGMGFRLVTPAPVEMRVGTVIDYRLRVMGWPLRWRSLISRWEPPAAFVDEQLRGPYASWVHTHTFAATAGGTRIRDEVRYALPFAPLGDIGLFFVRRQLEGIFTYREKAIRAALLGAD